MNQPVSKSSLSKAQCELVELCQQHPFSRIEDLLVQHGEPVFTPPPTVIQKLKMGGDNSSRPESSLQDFLLKRQMVELLETITALGDGQIRTIEVMHGLPLVVEIERPVPDGYLRARERIFERAYAVVVRSARVRAAGLSLLVADREEFEQEIVLGVWVALPKFDAGKASLATFIDRVAATKATSLARRASAKKRGECPLPRGPDPLQLLRRLELQVDFERVLRTLDKEDRRLADLLSMQSAADAARALRVSRATVYRQIDRIRDTFVRAGIAKYLRKAGQFSNRRRI